MQSIARPFNSVNESARRGTRYLSTLRGKHISVTKLTFEKGWKTKLLAPPLATDSFQVTGSETTDPAKYSLVEPFLTFGQLLNKPGVHRFNEPKLGRGASRFLAFTRKWRGVSDLFSVFI